LVDTQKTREQSFWFESSKSVSPQMSYNTFSNSFSS